MLLQLAKVIYYGPIGRAIVRELFAVVETSLILQLLNLNLKSNNFQQKRIFC